MNSQNLSRSIFRNSETILIYPATWIVLGLLFIAKMIFIFWTINMGFDITDEGNYMLVYKFPDSDPYPFHEYQTVLAPVMKWFGHSIIAGRVLRILLECGGLTILWFGWMRYFSSAGAEGRVSLADKAVAFFFLASGTFLSLFPRTISYNDFTNFGMLATAAILFTILSPAKKIPTWALAGTGFVFAFLFFIKFPPAILFFLVVTFCIGFSSNRWKNFTAFFAGIISGTIAFFLIQGDPMSWPDRFVKGKEIVSLLGYDAERLVREIYIPDLFELSIKILPAVAVFLAASFAIRRNGDEQKHAWIPFAGAIAFFAILCAIDNRNGFESLTYAYRHSGSIYSGTVFLLLALMILVLFLFRLMDRRKSINLLAAALTLLPFLGMAGTDTSFSVSIYAYVLPEFAVILFLLQRNFIRPFPLNILIVAMGLFANSLFYYHSAFHPYRLAEPLSEQTETCPQLPGILIDQSSSKFIEDVWTQLKLGGFKSGDPVIALSDMPGVVFAVGASSPGAPWYFELPHSDAYNCHHLRNVAGQTAGERPFILIDSAATPAVLQCLESAGIGYPGEYTLQWKGFNPWRKVPVQLQVPSVVNQ